MIDDYNRAALSVIELARKAYEYHRLGYESDSGFDANVQIRILDKLGEALDNLDAAEVPR